MVQAAYLQQQLAEAVAAAQLLQSHLQFAKSELEAVLCEQRLLVAKLH